MIRLSSIRSSRVILGVLTGFAAAVILTQFGKASDAAANPADGVAPNLVRAHRAPHIECLTPDGRLQTVPNAGEKNSNSQSVLLDDAALHYPLQAGDTTFIISLPKELPLDHFTFVNENSRVQGDMRIAVSDSRLPADSPKWVEVNGKTEFVSKRSFDLLLVGVEARYVKLFFHVERTNPIASVD